MPQKIALYLILLIANFAKAQKDVSKVDTYLSQFLEVEYVDTVAMRVFTDSALYYAEKSGDAKSQAIAFRYKGWYYQDMANYHKAESAFMASLHLYEKLGIPQEIANAHGNLGTVYIDMKHHIRAIEHQLKSLEINKMIVQTELDSLKKSKAYNSIGASLSNLSTIFNDLGEVEKAIEYQKESIEYELLKGDENALGLAISYHGLSISLRTLNQLDSALVYIDKALLLYEINDYNLGLAQANIQKGRILDAMEKFERSEVFMNLGYELSKRTGNQKDIAIAASNLCGLYTRMKNAVKAKSYLEELKVISDYQNDINNEQNLYVLQADYYELIGKPDSAYKYYKLNIALRDSLYSREKDKEIIYNEYEYKLREQNLKDSIQHQLELKNEEEKLLSAKAKARAETEARNYMAIGLACVAILSLVLVFIGRSRKKLNTQLNMSLQERDILLKEIHHRVKNNLQIVSSLLNLQSQKGNEKSAEELLTMSQNRVQTMALIHEKLYQSESLSSIQFIDYLKNLIVHIETSFGLKEQGVSVSVTGDQVVIDIDQLVPCGLIVNELITNSIKHAFEPGQGGAIEVRVKHEDNYCMLTVIDDGGGLDETFELDSTKSLGMRLAKGLCKQLKSQLHVDSKNGTKFYFKFKLESS